MFGKSSVVVQLKASFKMVTVWSPDIPVLTSTELVSQHYRFPLNKCTLMITLIHLLPTILDMYVECPLPALVVAIYKQRKLFAENDVLDHFISNWSPSLHVSRDMHCLRQVCFVELRVTARG